MFQVLKCDRHSSEVIKVSLADTGLMQYGHPMAANESSHNY